MGTAYIVNQAFPDELGTQTTPGQNFPPVKYGGAIYELVCRENLFGDPGDPSTFAMFKTVNNGVAFTGQDTGNEQSIEFAGGAYSDCVGYYPPEGGNKVYVVYGDGGASPSGTLSLVIFNLDTDTWAPPIIGGPDADPGNPVHFVNFIVRTTGEWIIFFHNFGGPAYVSYDSGWGSPVSLLELDFNTMIVCGRDDSDNVVFYGSAGGLISTFRLSSTNVLSARNSSGITTNSSQDQFSRPVYVPDTDEFVTAYSRFVFPNWTIRSIKCDAATCSSFTTEVIAGPRASNLFNGLGPSNPLNIGPLQSEQGLGWPRLALSIDGLSLYCAYNLNDDSVASLNTNSIILGTQVVGEITWDAGTTLFDTNVDTLVPDNHIAFDIDPATPVPCYRMGFAIFSDGTQAFSYGTITYQTEETNPDPDDFGNNQYYFEVGGEPPPVEIAIACPLDPPTATIGVEYNSGPPIVTGDFVEPLTFSLAGGALPDGYTLDPDTGEVDGITYVAGMFGYTLRVTDADGNTAVVEAPCPITVGGSSGTLPCDNITPQPETDNRFKLIKVIATFVPAKHLPTRGSVQ